MTTNINPPMGEKSQGTILSAQFTEEQALTIIYELCGRMDYYANGVVEGDFTKAHADKRRGQMRKVLDILAEASHR